MVIDNVFGISSTAQQPRETEPGFFSRALSALSRRFARLWCGMHGHLVLMHFEPNKLSLQCALCGYESDGWEVGRPMVARRQSDNRSNRSHSHNHNVRVERRRSLRAVPSTGAARLAS